MYVNVKYLPAVINALLLITIIITLALTYGNGHVSGSLPYISDTGTKSPESCIFGQALNLLWVLISFVMYIKYRQVKDVLNRYDVPEKKTLNKRTLQIGLLAAFGSSIVANFQETNVVVVHWIGAVLVFGFGAAYQWMQTMLYMELYLILGQRKRSKFRIFLSVVSIVTFSVYFICGITSYQFHTKDNSEYIGSDSVLHWMPDDGGFILHNVSVISEWICAISTMTYISFFHWEFEKITVYEPDVFVEDKIKTTLNMERTNEGFDDK